MLIVATWLLTGPETGAAYPKITVVTLTDLARRARRIHRRRLAPPAGRGKQAAITAEEASSFRGCFCGKACGFWLISCSTSRCRRTSTSCRIVTFRLISIGLSGALTEMQLASGADRQCRGGAAALDIGSHFLSHLVLGWRGGVRPVRSQASGLLLLFLRRGGPRS